MATKLGELDTSALPEQEAREVEAMVATADLPKLLAASPMRGKGADRFQYQLVIEDDDGRHELTVSEDQMPEALRPLVDRVRASHPGA